MVEEVFAEVWVFKDAIESYISESLVGTTYNVEFKSNGIKYTSMKGFFSPSGKNLCYDSSYVYRKIGPYSEDPYEWAAEEYKKISLYEPASGDFLSFLEQAANRVGGKQK